MQNMSVAFCDVPQKHCAQSATFVALTDSMQHFLRPLLDRFSTLLRASSLLPESSKSSCNSDTGEDDSEDSCSEDEASLEYERGLVAARGALDPLIDGTAGPGFDLMAFTEMESTLCDAVCAYQGYGAGWGAHRSYGVRTNKYLEAIAATLKTGEAGDDELDRQLRLGELRPARCC